MLYVKIQPQSFLEEKNPGIKGLIVQVHDPDPPALVAQMRVQLVIKRLQVRAPHPTPGSTTFFRGDRSWNIFYDHSLPSTDSRGAVISFWQKNVRNTG